MTIPTFEQAQAANPSGERLAMVVDDSRAIRTILSRALGELGWRVLEAKNGQHALEVLAGSESQPAAVSLILVDWNMPEMNGIDFVRRIRTEQRYASTRLMMVTTETQVEQMMAALEAGANEYVMKPFTKEVIEEKLRVLGLL
jgi:two-component system chemotaxis response regulator CheY